MVRSSPPLFWSTRPVPLSPVTVPPTVKVEEPPPPPPPLPPPPLVALGPLQAARTRERAINAAKRKGFTAGFILVFLLMGWPEQLARCDHLPQRCCIQAVT